MRTTFRLVAATAAGVLGSTATVALGPSATAAPPRWRVSHVAKAAPFVNEVVAPARNDAWAFGVREIRSDLPKTPVAYRWNGKAWRLVALPAGKRGPVLASSATSVNNVWAVTFGFVGESPERMRAAVRNPGSLSKAGPSNVPSAALRWNGRKWAVAKSWRDLVLTGVTTLGPRDVWVFGYNNKAQRGETWHFDGRQWARAKVPFTIQQASARSAKDIWAVGYSQNHVFGAVVIHYDGRRWRRVSVGHVLPRDPKHPGEPPAENVSFSGITATGKLTLITGELQGERVSERFAIVRDKRGWHREMISRVVHEWGESGQAVVGPGSGMSFLAMRRTPRGWEPTVAHRSGAGRWTQRLIRIAGRELGLIGISRVPGTGSLWAVGEASSGNGSVGVVLRS